MDPLFFPISPIQSFLYSNEKGRKSMAKIISHKTHTSGIALGGLGTGSVELLPDGEFHFWQIYNTDRWSKCCREQKVDDGEKHTGALSFWIRTQTEDQRIIIRKLGMRTDSDDFTYRMFGWNKPVEEIEFDGKFPVCELTYRDSVLPCDLKLQAVAPFVPHDYQASATPGFYLDFTVKNPTQQNLEISLLSLLTPSFLKGGSCNQLIQENATSYLCFQSQGKEDDPAYGSLCLAGEGDGNLSYLTGDFLKFTKEYVSYSDYGVSQESILFSFREEGKLPNSSFGSLQKLNELFKNSPFSHLSEEELDKLILEISDLPSARSILHRVQKIYPHYPACRAEKEQFLNNYQEQVHRMSQGMENPFGGGALCQSLTLAPGKSAKLHFLLSWYFPNHKAENGKRIGHYYENFYDQAQAACRYLVQNRKQVEGGAITFCNTLYQTDLPSFYPDCWTGQLSTLVKNSWWQKDGKFGIWEGLGYCGFHTTDITYHASFGLLALFPKLQLKQMSMTASFQRADGRVPHFFTPDLEHVDDGYHRVDMNMQFILMVTRDYLFTGDRNYLKKMWGPVCQAIASTARLDTDGDGLPDQETKRNTYDAWNFSGTPTYISLLWLAALKAASLLAEKVGDTDKKSLFQQTLQTGCQSLEERLWNGSYYNLWKNGEQEDGSLMSNQLDGEWFLRMIGIKGNLSDERVRQVLDQIMKNNFDREAGLINASCPDGHPTTLATYKNCQASAVWTGIGYAIAALAISVGKRETADLLVQTIHQNQASFGMLWDHWECGFRYSRPLSSFTTLLAFSGLSLDWEERQIRLHPMVEEGVIPICLPDCLALLTLQKNHLLLHCTNGFLTIKSLLVPSHYGSHLLANGHSFSGCPQKSDWIFRFPDSFPITDLEIL
jgi:uncharacterized protein (DUF608 family)